MVLSLGTVGSRSPLLKNRLKIGNQLPVSIFSLMPPGTGLSSIQFSILNVLESLILKDQKKYNNTEMKSGATFYDRHTTLNSRCFDYINIKLIPQEQPNQNKEMKIAESVLLFLAS